MGPVMADVGHIALQPLENIVQRFNFGTLRPTTLHRQLDVILQQ